MEINGYTYGFFGKRGQYRSKEGIASQDALYDIGVNWMCLAVAVMQKTCISTQMHFSYKDTPSDRDIMAAVERAHARGVKVCLKPMVNCEDHIWRARISFPEGEAGRDPYWDEWFDNYTDFMVYYAELAKECGCEMLCLGCEMCGTEHKEKHWRKLISRVREVYDGKLMYNTNHDHEMVANWYDAIDIIGTSAYYPVGAIFPGEKGNENPGKVMVDGMEYPALVPCADKDVMIRHWEYVAGKLEEVHKKWNKPIMFAEIGCRSAKNCASMPWDFRHTGLPHEEQEQADFYASCLEVFAKKEWFSGIFWWDWSTYIYHTKLEAMEDNGFNIHLKKAEAFLKDYYSKG